MGQLTISTSNRVKIGLFQFLIKEHSDIAPTVNMFTTEVSVTVVDFCFDASLMVDSEVLELTYTAGDDPLVIELAEIENSFAVDEEHSSAC